MRQPGIEPGSIAWKATMLTFTPPTLEKMTLIQQFKIIVLTTSCGHCSSLIDILKCFDILYPFLIYHLILIDISLVSQKLQTLELIIFFSFFD